MDLSSLTDEELLDLFKQNHTSDLFSELVRRYEQYVIRRCFYYLKNTDEAQDISQEVFIRLLTKAHTYHTDLPFKPWLNAIIYRRCIDHIKKSKQALHQEISVKIADTLAEEIATEAICPTIEILQELLDELNGQDKLILLLKYEQNWSIQSIQQVLNMNENTIKSRLKRSRKKLRKLVSHYSD